MYIYIYNIYFHIYIIYIINIYIYIFPNIEGKKFGVKNTKELQSKFLQMLFLRML